MELKCLNQLIGITRKACECFEDSLHTDGGDQLPEKWYTKSKSDYYLDELVGLVSMWQTAEASPDTTLAEYYLKSYNAAMRDTKKDVLKAIHDRYTKTEWDFAGSLGTKSFTQGLDVSDVNYAGIYLKMAPVIDGVMYLKSIGTMFEETETFNVFVYKRYIASNYYELVDTIEGVQSIANRYKANELEEPLVLPMYDDVEGQLEYFIVYETEGLTPKNNEPRCGLCGRIENTAARFVQKYGTTGNDVEALGSWPNASGYAYGLVLDVEFKCETESVICRMFDALPQWRDAYAGAVLLRAAIMVHNYIVTSPEVTRDNLLNIDNVAAQMGIWQTDYEQSITWLGQNVNPDVNDCYVCNSNKLKVTQVLL